MRVLVTRPLLDAPETVRLLEAMGHSALIAPLLEIRFFDGPPLSLDGVQAVLATSANGVRAFARRTDERALPIFAVGTQTAEAAKAAGFANVRSADGDADALAKAVAQWAAPDAGTLLHAAGKEAEGKLEPDLKHAGFSVRRETLYEAVAATELPAETADALKASTLDAVLFFSPRSARIFCECVNHLGLGDQVRSLIACCISTKAANALTLVFQEVRIAERPNQDALLHCLGPNRF
jgi:uroporphyrinogen-III synthase